MQFYEWRLVQFGIALYLVTMSCALLNVPRCMGICILTLLMVGFIEAVGPVITFTKDEDEE